MRAEQRLGELIALQKETVGLAQGKRSDLVPKKNQVEKPSLDCHRTEQWGTKSGYKDLVDWTGSLYCSR